MASVTLSPTGASGTSWTSPGNVTTQNNSGATYTWTGSGLTNAMTVTFPSAGLSSTDVIDGIQVRFRGQRVSGAQYVMPVNVTLPKGSAKSGVNSWGFGFSNETLGGAADKWGASWDASTDFASAWSLTFQLDKSTTTSTVGEVDYVEVTITYHPGIVVHDAAASLTHAPTISATAVREVSAAASLALAPTITTAAQREAIAAATLALEPTITAAARVDINAAATLSLAPTITATATRETEGGASLVWAGTISASAIVVGSDVVSASLTLEPTITATALVETAASADLTLEPTITADATVIVIASANLTLAAHINATAIIKTSSVVLHAIRYGSARETQIVAGAPHTLAATGSARVVAPVAGSPHTINERHGSARQIATMKGSRA